MSLEAKPKAATRALEIYLGALLGGMAIAATLLFASAVDTATVKADAAAPLATGPSATATLPEPASAPSGPDPDRAIGSPPAQASAANSLRVAPGGLPQTASAEAPANAGGLATIGVVDRDAIAALPNPAEAMPARSNPTTHGQDADTAGSDPVNLATLATTASTPRAAQPFASTHRARRDAARRLQWAAPYPRRSRPLLRPLRAGPSFGMAAPLRRGIAGPGCPAGSDPRWGEPDATGVPALICNPYHRSLSVDVF